jgi:hypothetical protein
MNEHWDYKLIDSTGREIKVEVKAMKKIRRSDPTTQDKYTWIEIHGVREWDKGWLFGGKADLIAFETKNSFVLVDRKRLINFVIKNLSEEVVYSPEEALQKDEEGKYKKYRRRKNQKISDELILIEVDKLKEIAEEEWEL